MPGWARPCLAATTVALMLLLVAILPPGCSPRTLLSTSVKSPIAVRSITRPVGGRYYQLRALPVAQGSWTTTSPLPKSLYIDSGPAQSGAVPLWPVLSTLVWPALLIVSILVMWQPWKGKRRSQWTILLSTGHEEEEDSGAAVVCWRGLFFWGGGGGGSSRG